MTTQQEASYENCSRQLFTTKEASTFIGMSEYWLKASRFRPELAGPPFCKLGRCVRYDHRDLEAWIIERKYRGTFEMPSNLTGVCHE